MNALKCAASCFRGVKGSGCLIAVNNALEADFRRLRGIVAGFVYRVGELGRFIVANWWGWVAIAVYWAAVFAVVWWVLRGY